MRKVLAGVLIALLLVPAAAQAEDWTTGRLVKVLVGGGAVAVGVAVAAKSSQTTTTTSVIGTSESSTFSKSQLITGLAVAGTGGIILWDGLRSHSPGPSTQIGVSAGRQSRGMFIRRVW
jgi:threonine dehydratase